MKYIIEPFNEGREMNCRHEIKGKQAVVLAKASCIAAAIQAVLPQCSISCEVRPVKADGEIFPVFSVTPDGKAVRL